MMVNVCCAWQENEHACTSQDGDGQGQSSKPPTVPGLENDDFRKEAPRSECR